MKKSAIGKSPMRIPFIFGMMIALLPPALFAQQPWRLARGFTQQAGDDSIKVRRTSADEMTFSFEYSLPALKVKNITATAKRIKLGSAPQRSRPGEPVVPVIPVQIVLPAGRDIDHVALRTGMPVEVPGSHRIEHGQKPIPLLKDASRTVTEPDAKIYNSDDPYPARRVELVSVQKKRGVGVAIINIFPLAYHPRSGRLVGYSSVTLDVITKPTAATGLGGARKIQRQLYMSVENPEALDSYENGSLNIDNGGVQPLGICNPADSYRYVIITSAALRDATTDITLRDFIAHKQSRGMSATIVTVEDIYSSYTGVDNPERIRNFIIDAYSNWETEYVLLGGDVNIIPVRYLYDNGTTIPSDLYYQCLDGNFNSDGDSYWGEPTDGPGGRDVDLMAEVAIGRASAENAAEMSNFVYKTIAYADESESSPYLRQAMLLGEYLGSQFGPGVYAYAYPYMKEIHHGSSASGYTTAGFDACPAFGVDSMYDYFRSWPASDLIARFNSNTVSIYNHLGHANETYVMKLTNSNVDTLTNTKPFFAYSQGCYPGDYTTDCIAEHFTTSHRRGAFAVVFNSRYGWGAYNNADATLDGPSQRFNRQFWDAYFNEFILNLGDVNADSHEDNIWDINGTYIRWCMYETNLFGDPQILIRGQVTGPHVQYLSHTISDAAGNNDGLVNPGELITIRPTVVNVGSQNAAGINLVLTTTDGFVTIVDNTADVGNILCCGSSQQALDDMAVNISSICPTPRTIRFTLTARDNASSEWTSEFSITVYTSSQVSGQVRAAATGAGIPGATVSFTGPLRGSVTTDASGYYLFGGIDGTYSVTAIANGYLASAPVSVTLPPTVKVVDFNLVRPLISHTPDHLRVDVISGGTEHRTMTIVNRGDAPLNFTVAARDNAASSTLSAEAFYDASHFLPIAKGAPDTRVGKPVNLRSGGPDVFGYRWRDSDEPGGPAFIWNDISGTGRILTTVSSCDDCSEQVALSFPFKFYGTEFTSIYVSSNGYITFGAGSSQYSNYALPSTSMPANLIAGFFDDLYPASGGTIYFRDFGDRAVVQFTNVAPFSGSGSFTYQMVIERNGTITYYYQSMSGTLTSATVGIQNAARNDGLTVVYNASYVRNGLAVQLRAAPAWLSVSPGSGTVPPGGSIDLDVQFSSNGLVAGLFSGNLAVEHNDPTSVNPLMIPCEMYVDGMRRLSATPMTVDFGSCWVGLSDTAFITLANSGDEATTVSSITSTNTYFRTVTSLPLTVQAFGSVRVPVIYQPGTVGSHSGTLSIASNAEDNPTLLVSLGGICVRGPQISVTPASFDVRMAPGATAMRTLLISNPGGDDLQFELRVVDRQLDALHVDAGTFSAKCAAAEAIKESVVVPGGHAMLSSHETTGGLLPKTVPDINNVNPAANTNVLIFRNNLAWGYNVNVPILTGMGANVTTASASQMATINLSQFNVIVFESQQPLSYYSSFLASISRFEQFLRNGGIISFHCAAYTSDRIPNLVLPGGMRTLAAAQLESTNTVNDPTHPVVQGSPATMTRNFASHEAFENLPQGARVIVVNSLGNPTTVEYRVGSGLLLATGMTWEWGYGGGYSCGIPILSNSLGYLLSLRTGPQWLSVNRYSGTVFPGATGDVILTFNSNGLAAGTYSAQLSISHNAPSDANPSIVPVSLTVRENGGGYISLITGIGISASVKAQGAAYTLRDITIGSPVAGFLRGNRYCLKLR